MTDQAEPIASKEAPEAPPLWGQTTFQRAKEGAADIDAQIKVDGESVRIEAAALVEKGEILTDPKGGCWIVADAKHRADGGYTWATLAPGRAEGVCDAPAEQQGLNQIEATPEAEAPRPSRRKPKVTDAESSPDAPESGSAESN